MSLFVSSGFAGIDGGGLISSGCGDAGGVGCESGRGSVVSALSSGLGEDGLVLNFLVEDLLLVSNGGDGIGVSLGLGEIGLPAVVKCVVCLLSVILGLLLVVEISLDGGIGLGGGKGGLGKSLGGGSSGLIGKGLGFVSGGNVGGQGGCKVVLGQTGGGCNNG